MLPDQESALLERAREYDQVAIAEIYDRYSLRIYNYIYHRLGNVHAAEDLTATVFLRMLEAIRTSKAWQTSFSGWLYRIAHNLVVDYFRTGQQDKNVPLDDWPLASGEHPAEVAERSISQQRVRHAIDQLTGEQGLVITLKFIEGMSNSEVATMVGKSEGAVKSLQFRGLATLRRLIGEEEL
ncbi:MAG: sigma-70 family RNA polymerase sigma factor [Chloroflexi bacterium]|nr:sigma-70 family RNA polymerase sigma factor [Chloroflexota bacterium]